MITHDLRWSLPRGNTLVPSRWQATPSAPPRASTTCSPPATPAPESFSVPRHRRSDTTLATPRKTKGGSQITRSPARPRTRSRAIGRNRVRATSPDRHAGLHQTATGGTRPRHPRALAAAGGLHLIPRGFVRTKTVRNSRSPGRTAPTQAHSNYTDPALRSCGQPAGPAMPAGPRLVRDAAHQHHAPYSSLSGQTAQDQDI
jgi:hypothetical protein